MKRLLLSAVLLLSVSLSAQDQGGVGINTDEPTAALDVNGKTRIRNVEPCDDCSWGLVIDTEGNVKKRERRNGETSDLGDVTPCNNCTWVLALDETGNVKKRPVGADGKINFYGEVRKRVTKKMKSKNCTKRQRVEVTSPEFVGTGIGVTQEEADKKARENLIEKSKSWFEGEGTVIANQSSDCVRWDGPELGAAVCNQQGQTLGEIGWAGVYTLWEQKSDRYVNNTETGQRLYAAHRAWPGGSSNHSSRYYVQLENGDLANITYRHSIGDDYYTYHWVRVTGAKVCDE